MDLFDSDTYYDSEDFQKLEDIRQQSDATTILVTMLLIGVLILYAAFSDPFDKTD